MSSSIISQTVASPRFVAPPFIEPATVVLPAKARPPLFEAGSTLLCGPIERQVDVRGEFQINESVALGDRLDDFRREKREPYQASDVAVTDSFALGDRGVVTSCG